MCVVALNGYSSGSISPLSSRVSLVTWLNLPMVWEQSMATLRWRLWPRVFSFVDGSQQRVVHLKTQQSTHHWWIFTWKDASVALRKKYLLLSKAAKYKNKTPSAKHRQKILILSRKSSWFLKILRTTNAPDDECSEKELKLIYMWHHYYFSFFGEAP